MTNLRDVKDHLLNKVEARFRELTSEVSKSCREKRKAIEGRKNTLDRFHIQADYAISFVDYGLLSCDNDSGLLMAKRTMDRQLRRLKKVDPSTGLSDSARDF